ncbi:hypothetical protein BDN71DRAFT_1530460 [Pleurotus eryngii]|uniref:Uncharacterized protein n=1 Tax=Pleurotus eryngii TaxID=5323 RepID=A0A9P6A2C3_PLEER|nr:hypothetical protein BDN71DRAFT_1530460 [Pleurotus eryngii]
MAIPWVTPWTVTLASSLSLSFASTGWKYCLLIQDSLSSFSTTFSTTFSTMTLFIYTPQSCQSVNGEREYAPLRRSWGDLGLEGQRTALLEAILGPKEKEIGHSAQ